MIDKITNLFKKPIKKPKEVVFRFRTKKLNLKQESGFVKYDMKIEVFEELLGSIEFSVAFSQVRHSYMFHRFTLVQELNYSGGSTMCRLADRFSFPNQQEAKEAMNTLIEEIRSQKTSTRSGSDSWESLKKQFATWFRGDLQLQLDAEVKGKDSIAGVHRAEMSKYPNIKGVKK